MIYSESNLTADQESEVISLLGSEEYSTAYWRIIPTSPNYCVNSLGTHIVRLKYVSDDNHVQASRDMKFYLAEYLEWQHGFVHSAVGSAFLSDFEPYPKKVVNHIDGNKFNNNITNLEICTQQENTAHFWTADCFEEARSIHNKRLSESLKGKPSWRKGKKLGPDLSGATHNKGTIGVNKDGINKMINPEDLDSYLSQGWVRGQIQHHVITDEIRRKLSEASKGRPGAMKGKHHSEETKEKMRKASTEYMNRPDVKKKRSEMMKGQNNPFYGKHHSKETRELISRLNKGRVHTEAVKKHLSEVLSGENAPMYGRPHTELSKQKMRKAMEGRECPNKGKVWITNGCDNKMIFESEMDNYPGYHLGCSKKQKENLKWITNGKDSKRVIESEICNYPGYRLGRTYTRHKFEKQ